MMEPITMLGALVGTLLNKVCAGRVPAVLCAVCCVLGALYIITLSLPSHSVMLTSEHRLPTQLFRGWLITLLMVLLLGGTAKRTWTKMGSIFTPLPS